MAIDFQPAPPVAPGNLPQHYAEVIAFDAESKKRTIRDNRIAWSLVAALAVANIGQGGAIAMMVPLTKVIPYFIIQHRDGSWEAAASMYDESPTDEKAAVEAGLWQYVVAREGYNYAGAPDNHDLVVAMSSPQIAEAYHDWFTRSKDSPQRVIDKKGQIHIAFRGMLPLSNGVFQIFYRREYTIYGEPEVDTNWHAMIGYKLLNHVPKGTKERLDHPARIQITSYSTVQDTPH
jgi:type IV secretion system protein VirB8